jgi:acyl dehydratase
MTAYIDTPFDELEIGQTWVSGGRTMTEADVVNFCMLTGNWLEIHSNAEYCKDTRFGQRLVQGSLVFSVMAGLTQYSSAITVAFYGIDKIRFLTPVFIGDTVRFEVEVIGKQDKDDKYGVGKFRTRSINASMIKSILRYSTCRTILLIGRVSPLTYSTSTPSSISFVLRPNGLRWFR